MLDEKARFPLALIGGRLAEHDIAAHEAMTCGGPESVLSSYMTSKMTTVSGFIFAGSSYQGHLIHHRNARQATHAESCKVVGYVILQLNVEEQGGERANV